MVDLASKRWPVWWTWELELSSHVLKRMIDRRFNEVDIRQMLQDASGMRADVVPGRWIVQTRRGRRAWEVVVEPDAGPQRLVVVTAYQLESSP